MNKKINWSRLAECLGTIQPRSESGGSSYAKLALEKIVGEEALREAVDYYVTQKPGSELARSVLWNLQPWSAMLRCYEIFRDSTELETRRAAVELLRVVADGRALPWVEEFLNDPDEGVQNWGAGLVDQLLWSETVEEDECEIVLTRMKDHSNKHVRDKYNFIREFLDERAVEEA